MSRAAKIAMSVAVGLVDERSSGGRTSRRQQPAAATAATTAEVGAVVRTAS
jgi:hypothetical protein